jgi:hypothetical protein
VFPFFPESNEVQHTELRQEKARRAEESAMKIDGKVVLEKLANEITV